MQPEHSSQMPVTQWLDQLEVPKESPDCLGRESFARTLADAIARMPHDRSVVTAVFGPWGCGKTWLLERIIESIQKEHSAALNICRFSPWELKSQEQILLEFFRTIAEKIPPKSETKQILNLWEELEQYAMVGSLGTAGLHSAIMLAQGAQFAAIPPLLASFASLFSRAAKARKSAKTQQKQKTLAEVKDELSEELQSKLSRPILVVIDDLDRLTHGEIQMMIRLLNTTANLPKLHYLIFGDRQQIASALDPVCGDQGDRYLEKLVQNTFQVPEPGENQIRLRLWDGLEKIAQESEFDLSPHAKRFAHFWDTFLKFRIKNLRDCHRLLRTLAFHTGALTQDGTLEVDLLDLLGTDFLRVFDPPLYHRLASEFPTQNWCLANLSTIEKDDSQSILELIKISTLGKHIACGLLLSLFPHLSQYIQKFLKENQLQMLGYRNDYNQTSPLGICSPDRAEIYFRLSIGAADLPEAKVKEFAGITDDPVRMYHLLKDFQSRKWLLQLFARLKSDPQLISTGQAAAKVLLALSSISDELEYNPGPVDDELEGGYALSRHLIGRMATDGAEREVIPAIREAGGVSLGLLLLEQMRNSSSCEFFEGSKAPTGLLKLPPEEIEILADAIHPEVSRKFWQDHFMNQKFEASRAYRMAHALGPKRTQEILERAADAECGDKVWNLIESIALSMMIHIDLNSLQNPEKGSKAGATLLEHLMQFASFDFWSHFLANETPKSPSKFTATLIPHLETAIHQKKLDHKSPKRDYEELENA